jgi:hypothetical protein
VRTLYFQENPVATHISISQVILESRHGLMGRAPEVLRTNVADTYLHRLGLYASIHQPTLILVSATLLTWTKLNVTTVHETLSGVAKP